MPFVDILQRTLGVDQREFATHVADAYEHLYDLVYLRAHPLVPLLVTSPDLSEKKRARQLHRLLLDVISELDPGPQAPSFSHEWRRHRLLVLRYVKGLNPQAVADQLIMSLRHYYRIHSAAIADVASLLWERYAAQPQVSHPDSALSPETDAANRLELLRLEAARMVQADRYARVSDVLERVLPLLQEMSRQHRIEIHPVLDDSLPGVSIDQSLLRQLLLGTIGYLLERAEQGMLYIRGQVEGPAACLSLIVEPSEAVHAMPADGAERLQAFAEMATLANAHILPLLADGHIVGFDLQLPIAERTVLVVDDNEDVLELFRGYLSPHRYRVVTARTAHDALETARLLQPYAITLDLMMPGQDGWDLLQILLNQPDTCHIPVIVCSVLKQKELALSLGATAFLEKPITEQALLSALEALSEN